MPSVRALVRTEIASTSRELAKAINEEPHPVPRVYVEGQSFALQCRHCEMPPAWTPVPTEPCAAIRKLAW